MHAWQCTSRAHGHPTANCVPPRRPCRTLTTLPPRPMHEELPSDPDNTPPRSRLFMVVPKSAEGSIIEVCAAGAGMVAAAMQERHSSRACT